MHQTTCVSYQIWPYLADRIVYFGEGIREMGLEASVTIYVLSQSGPTNVKTT